MLPIEGLVDLQNLCARLEKDLLRAEKEITVLSNRLSNPSFSEKAPEKVVGDCKAKLEEAEAQASLVRKRLSALI